MGIISGRHKVPVSGTNSRPSKAIITNNKKPVVQSRLGRDRDEEKKNGVNGQPQRASAVITRA